jgi:endonuclease/exonuclease/phosphatase family metal-dependent hydrolase
MPTGRFIAGETATPLGPIRIAGLCIPWSHAHVATGRKDRKMWQDHESYLSGLETFLAQKSFEKPTILAGDFNQTIPRSRAPKPLYEQLITALTPSFNVTTAGELAKFKKLVIDHLAVTKHLSATSIRPISNLERSGKQLSDHIGLCIDLARV